MILHTDPARKRLLNRRIYVTIFYEVMEALRFSLMDRKPDKEMNRNK